MTKYNRRAGKLGQKSLYIFTIEVAEHLRSLGRVRTAETYIAALRSFSGFRGGEDIDL